MRRLARGARLLLLPLPLDVAPVLPGYAQLGILRRALLLLFLHATRTHARL